MTKMRLRYQTLEVEEHDIHVCSLRDTNQYEDDGGISEGLGISSAMWPIFGVVWDSGQVLANEAARRHIGDARVLEVGCGIALASLVLNQQGVDITATDRHPRAAEFLSRNTELNGDHEITFVRTSWAEPDTGIGTFDLILGSDLLYSHEHAAELSAFIHQHAGEHCAVVLVDPGRGHRSGFVNEMEALGFSLSRHTVVNPAYLPDPYRCQVLEFTR